VDRQSIRARFHRLGPFSFDIDVFAYFLAADWEHFLQIQEQLLFGVTETVRLAGTALALPSQTMYVSGAAQPLTELADAAPGRTR
jgi:MscS family membrane protein